MKIAHLIMAYKNPSQLERLIRRLNHPNFDVYIHLDKKIDFRGFERLKSIERVSFIRNRTVCNWGGFSFVKAITRSLSELLDAEKYEYVNLLSAQDYPLRPVSEFYDFLVLNKGRSFMSFEESDSEWWQHAVTRYEYFHFTDFNIKGRYIFQRIINSVAPKRRFPLPYKMYGCAKASWWTMTADHVRYLVDFINSDVSLSRFMRFTWAADEFLFPTLVLNSPYKDQITNNNLRYIEWNDGESNPRIFASKDLEELKSTDAFFARKFDTLVDAVILDKLDVSLLNNNYN